MGCPRNGEKCYEFMCGSSIDGICGGTETNLHKAITELNEHKVTIGSMGLVTFDACIDILKKYVKD